MNDDVKLETWELLVVIREVARPLTINILATEEVCRIVDRLYELRQKLNVKS